MIFDEVQKIKSPDTINTHSAKVVNADFVMGITGTPIENRIEDLWCIMDRVAPGMLGSLKAFSRTYGGNDEDHLRKLKAQLDQPTETKPPVMLRRMKEDHIDGLPARHVKTYSDVKMPSQQAEAYSEVVSDALKGVRSKGQMLRIIHRLRGVSLHPYGGGGMSNSADTAAWAEASARGQAEPDFLRLQAHGRRHDGLRRAQAFEDRSVLID